MKRRGDVRFGRRARPAVRAGSVAALPQA